MMTRHFSESSHYGATDNLLEQERNVPFSAEEMSHLQLPESRAETADVQPPGEAGPQHGPPGAQLGFPGPAGRGLRCCSAWKHGSAQHRL